MPCRRKNGPRWKNFDAFLRHSKEREEAYAAGFKAGLERAAVIAGRQTGWVAGTIQDDIREEIEKI